MTGDNCNSALIPLVSCGGQCLRILSAADLTGFDKRTVFGAGGGRGDRAVIPTVSGGTQNGFALGAADTAGFQQRTVSGTGGRKGDFWGAPLVPKAGGGIGAGISAPAALIGNAACFRTGRLLYNGALIPVVIQLGDGFILGGSAERTGTLKKTGAGTGCLPENDAVIPKMLAKPGCPLLRC